MFVNGNNNVEYNCSIGTKQSRIRPVEQRLNSYGDKLLFLQAGYHSQQAVISKECLHSQYFSDTPSFSGAKASLILRELVLKCIEEAIQLPWTPTIESLVLREKQYLKLWSLFLKDYCLLNKATIDSVIETVNRIPDLFSQDIIHTGPKGKNSAT